MRLSCSLQEPNILPVGEVPANTPTSPAGTSTSKLHIPSEHHLGLPIRRYISDTVVNQLLGQPSHSLACVLMVAVEALGVVVTKEKPMKLEDACRMVSFMEGVKLSSLYYYRLTRSTSHQSLAH